MKPIAIVLITVGSIAIAGFAIKFGYDKYKAGQIPPDETSSGNSGGGGGGGGGGGAIDKSATQQSANTETSQSANTVIQQSTNQQLINQQSTNVPRQPSRPALPTLIRPRVPVNRLIANEAVKIPVGSGTLSFDASVDKEFKSYLYNTVL